MQKELRIEGEVVPIHSTTVCSCNILEVSAGTNGLKGGDSSHGSRTYFRIEDDGGTAMNIRPIGKRSGYGQGVEVVLMGDTELETIIEALKFIVLVLENGLNGATNRSAASNLSLAAPVAPQKK